MVPGDKTSAKERIADLGLLSATLAAGHQDVRIHHVAPRRHDTHVERERLATRAVEACAQRREQVERDAVMIERSAGHRPDAAAHPLMAQGLRLLPGEEVGERHPFGRVVGSELSHGATLADWGGDVMTADKGIPSFASGG
jgi:hypothetical protein